MEPARVLSGVWGRLSWYFCLSVMWWPYRVIDPAETLASLMNYGWDTANTLDTSPLQIPGYSSPAFTVICFGAIHGVQSEVYHTTFPAKTESIKAGTSKYCGFLLWTPSSVLVHPMSHQRNKSVVAYYVACDALFKVPKSTRFGDPLWLVLFWGCGDKTE